MLMLCIFTALTKHQALGRVFPYISQQPGERKKVKSFSHIQLFATLWTIAHQAPQSMGILQERILEWVAISFSRGPSWPRDRTRVPHIADRLFTFWGTRGAPQAGEFGIKMMPALPAWKLILTLIDSLWSQATNLPGGWGVTWTPTPAYGALHGSAWPMAVKFTKYIAYEPSLCGRCYCR